MRMLTLVVALCLCLCTLADPIQAQDGFAGKWAVTQDNGGGTVYTGTLVLQPDGTGTMRWNNFGQPKPFQYSTSGASLSFVLDYGGFSGKYKAQLVNGHLEGTTGAANGDSATWSADRR